MSDTPEPYLVRHDPVDDRPIGEHALEAIRTAPNPSRELDLAFAVIARGAEIARLRKRLAFIERQGSWRLREMLTDGIDS